MKTAALIVLLALPCALAARSPQPEATSLFCKPLVSAPPAGETKARLEADLAKAQADYDRVVAGKAWTAFGFIAAEADLKRGI
jgi:hypothetical protein